MRSKTNEELDGYDTSSPSGSNHLRLGGFDEPIDIDIDPGNDSEDGESTWVADRNNNEAVKIASDGTEIVRVTPTGFFEMRQVSVDSRDGSVWVGDPNSDRVAKLSALGDEVQNLSINPPLAPFSSPSMLRMGQYGLVPDRGRRQGFSTHQIWIEEALAIFGR